MSNIIRWTFVNELGVIHQDWDATFLYFGGGMKSLTERVWDPLCDSIFSWSLWAAWKTPGKPGANLIIKVHWIYHFHLNLFFLIGCSCCVLLTMNHTLDKRHTFPTENTGKSNLRNFTAKFLPWQKYPLQMLSCNPAPRGRGPFGQRCGWERIKRDPRGRGWIVLS